MHSCLASFSQHPGGPARASAGAVWIGILRLSAPLGTCQRAGLPLDLCVTQGLAESVLRTEILAKGGQGLEQTAALLLRPGPRGQRCLTGSRSRVTGDLGEARKSQGPTPGEKRVDLALLFFP